MIYFRHFGFEATHRVLEIAADTGLEIHLGFPSTGLIQSKLTKLTFNCMLTTLELKQNFKKLSQVKNIMKPYILHIFCSFIIFCSIIYQLYSKLLGCML